MPHGRRTSLLGGKGLVALLLAVAIGLAVGLPLVSFPRPAIAASEGADASVIRVAFCPLNGFFEYDSQDARRGYGVDLLAKLSKGSDLRFDYVAFDSWAEAKQAVADGDADLCMPNSPAVDPTSNLSYSSESILQTYQAIMTLASNDDLFFNDTETFPSITVAVQSYEMDDANVAAYLASVGIDDADIVRCNSFDECRAALDSGRVDAVVSNVMNLEDDLKVVARFEESSSYAAMRSDDTRLAKLDSELAETKMEDPTFLSSLFSTWYPSYASTPLTRDEADYIKTCGTIEVGQIANRLPMSYVDSGTGKLVGINEDVLDWISQKTGLTFESKKIEEGTNPIDALKAVYKYRVPILAIAILVAACVTLFLVLIVNRQRSLGLSQERNVQLADALAQAQTASRAKGDFLARMSHEIRTPLNAVIGMSTLAHDHVDDPARIEDGLDKIDLSSQMLLSTINDVLDMSAIESDKIKIAHEPFDLDELILSLDTVYYAQCQQKGIDFDATSLVPPDEWFVGDQLRLSQVLNNLLSNAVKFTDEGGVTLSVLQTPISAERAYLEFKVSDTGCGMSPETLERLFQPFEQESAKTAQQHGGSGLGLAIAQNLVGLMHGDIQVTSTKGVGSTFVVTVPLETGTNAPRQAVDHDGRPDLSGRRALVVEDNETNRIVAVGLLGKANVTCDTAANGQEALDLFGSFEPGTYDVILMDLQMPIMDGYEATRAIRACGHPDARTVPIIAMTANAFSEDLSRALGCGMNDRIVKPIDPQRMFDTLASYLKRR